MRKSIIMLALLIGGASMSLAQPGSVVNFKDILLGQFPDTTRLSTWMEWVEQNIGGGGGADSVRAAHKADTVTSALPQAQINGLTAALGAKADTAGNATRAMVAATISDSVSERADDYLKNADSTDIARRTWVKSAIHDTAEVLRTQMPAPGGTNGQLQYNNNGIFGGLNASTLVVDSARAAGSAKNLQGGATGAIPFQTATGTTSFDANNLFWDNTNKRLGIRTTNPSVSFEVTAGPNQDVALFKVNSDLTGFYIKQTNTAASSAAFGVFDNSNYGVAGFVAQNINHGSHSSDFAIYTRDASGVLHLDRLYVEKNGNIGIGMTAPTAVLHLKAGTASPSTAPLKFTAGINLTTPEAGAMEFDGTNLYFTPSATRQTVTLSSDSSLKRNIVDYRNALQKVLAMRPVHFRYKVGSDTTLHVGLIAQELVHVDSSLVDYGVDGEARGVKYLEVIPVLVRAIQEQDTRITALEKRNAFLGVFAGVLLVGLVVFIARKY
jgi:hypothetical protein